jgi:hypothetical protein
VRYEDRLAGTGPATDGTLQRLRVLLQAPLPAEGVWLDSRAWIVTARRTGGASTRNHAKSDESDEFSVHSRSRSRWR